VAATFSARRKKVQLLVPKRSQKRSSQAVQGGGVPPTACWTRLPLQEPRCASNCCYLVDSGSAFYIMLWKSQTAPSVPKLYGTEGSRNPCWGERPFTVTINSVPRRWDFLLAAASFPILGVDFLQQHGLLLDVANLQLLSRALPVASVVSAADQTDPAPSFRSNTEVVKATSSPLGRSSTSSAGSSAPSWGLSLPSPGSSMPSLSSSPPSPQGLVVRRLCRSGSQQFSVPAPRFWPFSHYTGCSISLQWSTQPATAKFHRLDPSRLAAAKAEFHQML
jgi:hypothetical protein